MLGDFRICDTVDTNRGERDGTLLFAVNCVRDYLGDDSVMLSDLLLNVNYDVVKVPKPLGETFVISPHGGEPLLFRSRVGMVNAISGPESRRFIDMTFPPDLLSEKAMSRFDVFHMIKRHAKQAGLPYSTCCHTFERPASQPISKTAGRPNHRESRIAANYQALRSNA
jgi:hypothetical protein